MFATGFCLDPTYTLNGEPIDGGVYFKFAKEGFMDYWWNVSPI